MLTEKVILKSVFGSVILRRIPEKLGKRFTTDKYVIGLENGKVVRTRNVRPKSLEDTCHIGV